MYNYATSKHRLVQVVQISTYVRNLTQIRTGLLHAFEHHARRVARAKPASFYPRLFHGSVLSIRKEHYDPLGPSWSRCDNSFKDVEIWVRSRFLKYFDALVICVTLHINTIIPSVQTRIANDTHVHESDLIFYPCFLTVACSITVTTDTVRFNFFFYLIYSCSELGHILHYTEWQCGVRSLPRAPTKGHSRESKP